MYQFRKHEISELNNELVISLYLDIPSVEFAEELTGKRKNNHTEENLEKSAKRYIREKFPNLKNATVKVIAGTMVITSLAFGATNVSKVGAETARIVEFNDVVDINGEYVESIDVLNEMDVIDGFEDGLFKPTNQLTRAEAASLLAKSLKLDVEREVGDPVFKDVQGGWYYGVVAALKEKNILNGYKDGTFQPNEPVTRAELAKMIVSAYDFLEEDEDDTVTFKDVNDGDWFKRYVSPISDAGITKGQSATNFAPNKNTTRAEAATFIYRSINIQEFGTADGRVPIDEISGSTVTINDNEYSLSENAQALINEENSKVLEGSIVYAQLDKDGKVGKLRYLGIEGSGGEADRNVLDGGGAAIEGSVIVNGDYVTINHLTIEKDLKVGTEWRDGLTLNRVTVNGETIFGDADTFTAAAATESIGTITVEDSILGDVTLNKENLRLETKNSTIRDVRVRSNAEVNIAEGSTLSQVTIDEGVTDVAVNGSVKNLEVKAKSEVKFSGTANVDTIRFTSSDTKVNFDENTRIGNVETPSEKKIEEMITNYDTVKKNIEKINNTVNEDHVPVDTGGGDGDGDGQTGATVVDQIDSLDIAAETFEDDVAAARAAYDQLSEEQKALVSNYPVLERAEVVISINEKIASHAPAIDTLKFQGVQFEKLQVLNDALSGAEGLNIGTLLTDVNLDGEAGITEAEFRTFFGDLPADTVETTSPAYPIFSALQDIYGDIRTDTIASINEMISGQTDQAIESLNFEGVPLWKLQTLNEALKGAGDINIGSLLADANTDGNEGITEAEFRAFFGDLPADTVAPGTQVYPVFSALQDIYGDVRTDTIASINEMISGQTEQSIERLSFEGVPLWKLHTLNEALTGAGNVNIGSLLTDANTDGEAGITETEFRSFFGDLPVDQVTGESPAANIFKALQNIYGNERSNTIASINEKIADRGIEPLGFEGVEIGQLKSLNNALAEAGTIELGSLVNDADTDKNGTVSEAELRTFIGGLPADTVTGDTGVAKVFGALQDIYGNERSNTIASINQKIADQGIEPLGFEGVEIAQLKALNSALEGAGTIDLGTLISDADSDKNGTVSEAELRTFIGGLPAETVSGNTGVAKVFGALQDIYGNERSNTIASINQKIADQGIEPLGFEGVEIAQLKALNSALEEAGTIDLGTLIRDADTDKNGTVSEAELQTFIGGLSAETVSGDTGVAKVFGALQDIYGNERSNTVVSINEKISSQAPGVDTLAFEGVEIVKLQALNEALDGAGAIGIGSLIANADKDNSGTVSEEEFGAFFGRLAAETIGTDSPVYPVFKALQNIYGKGVAYAPVGAVTDFTNGVTYVDGNFAVPADVTEFTFTDNGLKITASQSNGDWKFTTGAAGLTPAIEQVAYSPVGAVTELTNGVTYVDGNFAVPTDVTEFTFTDNGLKITASKTDGDWKFTTGAAGLTPAIEQVAYAPVGAVTDLTNGVTYVDGNFAVPTDVTEFTFTDNGLKVGVSLIEDKWEFGDPTAVTATGLVLHDGTAKITFFGAHDNVLNELNSRAIKDDIANLKINGTEINKAEYYFSDPVKEANGLYSVILNVKEVDLNNVDSAEITISDSPTNIGAFEPNTIVNIK